MRRVALLFLLLASMVLLEAASGSESLAFGVSAEAGDAALGARSPRLRLVSSTPLVVAGVGFASRERVTVTALTSLGPRVVRTRATERGTFRVLLGRFTQPCGKPFAVRARGGRGSLAVLRLDGQPCVPPPPR